MTRRHKQIVEALKAGAWLWRYSRQNSGWLIQNDIAKRVNKSTLDAMEEAKLIEVDTRKTTYREHGGDDVVYVLTTTCNGTSLTA